MLRSRPAMVLLLALLLPPGMVATQEEAAGQTPVTDWSERPDRYGPAGLVGPILPSFRSLEFRTQLFHREFQEHLSGRDDITVLQIQQDFDVVPTSRSQTMVVVDVQGQLLPWLAAGVRVPYVRNEADFANHVLGSLVSTGGLGDVEGHLMAQLHETWPVRAHVSAGVSVPTGSVTRSGLTPDQPSRMRTLPYPLQSGSGVFSLLPSGTLAVENQHGTVGFRAAGQIYLGENSREWRPGNRVEAGMFTQYRFNDWVSGSARVWMEHWGDVVGADPDVSPQRSPLHWTRAQGGTRVEVPVGMNIRFAEGALEGHRLGVELLMPLHQDLNGPQLRSRFGVAASWGYTFQRDGEFR